MMSGTQRDENNLFMARMDAPSPGQLQQRLVGMLSADGAVDDPYAQPHRSNRSRRPLRTECCEDREAQAEQILAAIGGNPKPWWAGPNDPKGMFLQGECRNGLLGSLLSCALALLAAHHNPTLTSCSDERYELRHQPRADPRRTRRRRIRLQVRLRVADQGLVRWVTH